MKLSTSILPRKDGTVVVAGLNGARYVFVKDESGELSCTIDDEATVAHLLKGQLFYPSDVEDMDAAIALTTGRHSGMGDGGGDDGNWDDLNDGDDLNEAALQNALPVEANTPAKTRRKPGPKPKATSQA